MNSLDIYLQIFSLVDQLFQGHARAWLRNCEPGDYLKSERPGLMALHSDVLDRSGQITVTIALTHNYLHNGDVIPDPDMQLRLFLDQDRAEALTLQDPFGFRQVYLDDQVDLSAKRELNAFLKRWLTNCVAQKHQFIP